MMGFLGITADITGFTLDSDVVMIGLIFASVLQLLKSEQCAQNRAELEQQRKSRMNK
jgi:hypothetical protein